MGADIVVGEGQSIGNALNFGGPYVGLFATRLKNRAPDAGTARRRDGRRRRAARLRADAVDARAAHPPREGDEQHLHQFRPVRARLLDPSDAARRDGSAAAGARSTTPTRSISPSGSAQSPASSVLNDAFFNEFTIRTPRPAAELIEDLAARGIIGGLPVSRLAPRAGLDDLIVVAATEVSTPADRASLRGGARAMSAKREARNEQPGPPHPPERGRRAAPRHVHRQSRARHGRGADLRDRPARRDRRRHRDAGAVRLEARRARARRSDRPARPHRAGGGAPLRAPVAQQLLDRRRALSARLVHDEAQPAPQREDGAPAGLRRRPSAAADRDRAGRAGAHRHAGARAADADRHERRGDVAKGRRARRIVRHDGDQGGARRARRGQDAHCRPGARFRARHQSRDRGADRLFGARRAGGRRRRRQRRSGARGAGARRRRDHADQSQHLRPVRAQHRRDRRGRARGGRLFLLRRREFQRGDGQDAARRPRRRRDAHQPAQDVLDAARRRRPGRRAGGAVRAARAVRARRRRSSETADRCRSSNTAKGRRRSAA